MFAVFDNDKPASVKGFPYLKNPDWKNNQFDTLEAAQLYAWHWLGAYAPGLPSDIRLNIPYDYSGGDKVVIRNVL